MIKINNDMEEIRGNEFSIHCGKNSDSFEKLEKLCNAEAIKLIEKLHIPEGSVICVPCWTEGPGFSELIGIEKFCKDENGNIKYGLDISETTL